MRNHVPVFASAIVAAAACSMAAAFASPPSGQFSFKDHARGQFAEQATLATPAGKDVVVSSYTLAPGADSGWRTQPGPAVLAVTKGKLTLHSAEGCATKEYPAGQAAVVPAGRYLLHNTGSEPLEFSGTFANLTPGPKPLADGLGEAAPANCEGMAGYAAGRPSGASVADYVRGGLVNPDAYGHTAHAGTADAIKIEAGKDVAVSSYKTEPGFSLGWTSHVPTIVVVTSGTATYYEGHDGKCVKTSSYTVGQGYVHNSRHTHMYVNEGNEPNEVTVVWFNIRHGDPLPVVGSAADALDFSPLPPTDCPRLR